MGSLSALKRSMASSWSFFFIGNISVLKQHNIMTIDNNIDIYKYLCVSIFNNISTIIIYEHGEFQKCESRAASGGGYPPVPGPGTYSFLRVF